MGLRNWLKRTFGRKRPGELPRPESTQGDPKATEMVSVWLANGGVHIAIRVGMWADAGKLDEREAWGFLLAEVVRQISHGMAMKCGWDPNETAKHVRASLLKNADGSGTVHGCFADRQ